MFSAVLLGLRTQHLTITLPQLLLLLPPADAAAMEEWARSQSSITPDAAGSPQQQALARVAAAAADVRPGRGMGLGWAGRAGLNGSLALLGRRSFFASAVLLTRGCQCLVCATRCEICLPMCMFAGQVAQLCPHECCTHVLPAAFLSPQGQFLYTKFFAVGLFRLVELTGGSHCCHVGVVKFLVRLVLAAQPKCMRAVVLPSCFKCNPHGSCLWAGLCRASPRCMQPMSPVPECPPPVLLLPAGSKDPKSLVGLVKSLNLSQVGMALVLELSCSCRYSELLSVDQMGMSAGNQWRLPLAPCLPRPRSA